MSDFLEERNLEKGKGADKDISQDTVFRHKIQLEAKISQKTVSQRQSILSYF